MSDEATLKSLAFYRDPSLHQAQALLNVSETGVLKYLSKLSHEDVETKRKVWVPVNGKLTSDTNIFEKKEG